MALLNPSVVLSSPLLASRFAVRRRAAVVDMHGRSKTSDQIIPRLGGIVAASGNNSQERGDDATTSSTTYTVITRFALRKAARGVAPDVVLFRGMELLVIDVADYLNFGAGWVEATCTSDRIEDRPVGAR